MLVLVYDLGVQSLPSGDNSMYLVRLFRSDTPMQAITSAVSWVNAQTDLSEVSISAFYDFAEKPSYVSVVSAKQYVGATKC